MQEGRVIGADGVRLATRTWSGPPDGPAYVLHHGLASSQHIWDLMVPGLARDATVVTFDARGHGESSKPSSGYGFDHTVADAVAVLKSTRRKRRILVGHSWGAMVALEVAARKPSAVSGVVLIDGGVGTMRDGFVSWAEAREALARCYAILDKLGARERAAFVLRYMEERTLEEVAMGLGVSLSTAKRLVNRSSERVSKHVGKDEGLRRFFDGHESAAERPPASANTTEEASAKSNVSG